MTKKELEAQVLDLAQTATHQAQQINALTTLLRETIHRLDRADALNKLYPEPLVPRKFPDPKKYGLLAGERS